MLFETSARLLSTHLPTALVTQIRAPEDQARPTALLLRDFGYSQKKTVDN